MDYPAGRQDLVTHARQHDAPQNVITVIEGGFSDRTYQSAADVSTEFGREVRGGEHPAAMETRREPGITAEEVRREETVRPETPAVEAPPRHGGQYRPSPISRPPTCRSTSRAWTTPRANKRSSPRPGRTTLLRT
ncbi:DUF2795 domain-containing protein [Methanoculleus chikugoensis]|uniref:DUF2795 domain-containing protein n=1 Tax=Methanoculleus chikugoensis TaxID=118126 RepID=UPI001FB1B996|nr:DUF2795 domain-containing protein [Methanoculleus chikugoensis]